MSKPKIVVVPNPHRIAQTQTYVNQLKFDDFLDHARLGDIVIWSGTPGTAPLWLANCDCINFLCDLRLTTSAMFKGENDAGMVSCMDQTYELIARSDDNDQIILTEEYQNPGVSVVMKSDVFKSVLHDSLQSLLWLLPRVLPELPSASYWDELVDLFPKP
ncbi:MAG: hypothetical protein R3C11_00210 [Planctomycetaceae bacterium]